MKRSTSSVVAVCLIVLMGYLPAAAVSKEIVQLQTQVQALIEQIARMQQSFDERMGVMRSLVEQSTDNINKVNTNVANLERALQQQNSNSGGKVDELSGQVQSLHDSMDEIKARLGKLAQQMDEMKASRENLNNGAPGTPNPGAASAGPPADVLYNNALRDYNGAKYDLAMQQFADYMKYYATTELAGNAQFYIADIEYRQGNYEQAVQDYDKVLEQFPGGNKAAAAQLKKGYALLELGDRQAGSRELNALIARYPRSVEAMQARDRLRKLPASSGRPSAGRRTPR